MDGAPDNWIARLRRIVGPEDVLSEPEDLRAYSYDGGVDRGLPEAVVFPESAQEIAGIVRLCAEEGVPYVARGAGTSLSGGPIPLRGGLVIALSRLNRILELDPENRRAVVEPGLVNIHLSQAAAPHGLYYAPDPSSQPSCTIGGNVAMNAGGPHCLKYGVTTDHVLGIEVVLPSGEIAELGGMCEDSPGYDVVGLMVGSEGTLGIITKITVRLCPVPEAARTLLVIYSGIDEASETVSAIIAEGIIPAALEMMDGPMMRAVEDYVSVGYPPDAGAVLIVEVDGIAEGLDEALSRITRICHDHRALDVRIAKDEAERARIWKGRKSAFGAIGRLTPSFYVQDGVVPRTKLPQVIRAIVDAGRARGFEICNVFHAGDGNLHPLIFFDSLDPGQVEEVKKLGSLCLALCAEAGGTITGEHGVGCEKREDLGLVFNNEDLHPMRLIKDLFDPLGLCNPEKIFPIGTGERRSGNL